VAAPAARVGVAAAVARNARAATARVRVAPGLPAGAAEAAMAVPPDRVLHFQGASNFRDLGGYPGHDGRPVCWRRLFRSAHLGGLTDADGALLQRLGVSRAFDFRGVHERAGGPYQLPGLRQHSLAIEPSVVQGLQDMLAAGERLDAAAAHRLMLELYRSLVNDQAHRFAEMFEQLLQDDTPAVFHCTAGKDRTGYAAALILLALGVPRHVVMQDYLLSNALYRRPELPATQTPRDVLDVLWRVEEGFLAAALDTLDAEHGGVERYLEQRLGLGRAALRALAQRYLQGEAELP
jgi:protein-tyrosine phosphatase